MRTSWIVKITTFSLWAFAVGSATFWTLQMPGNATPINNVSGAVTSTAADATEQAHVQQVAAALGAKSGAMLTPAAELAAKQSRFQLQGVLAVGTKSGAALISVDGKPAKPYRVGAEVEEGLEVTSVKAYEASLGTHRTSGTSTTLFTLTLPKPDPSLGLKK